MLQCSKKNARLRSKPGASIYNFVILGRFCKMGILSLLVPPKGSVSICGDKVQAVGTAAWNIRKMKPARPGPLSQKVRPNRAEVAGTQTQGPKWKLLNGGYRPKACLGGVRYVHPER